MKYADQIWLTSSLIDARKAGAFRADLSLTLSSRYLKK